MLQYPPLWGPWKTRCFLNSETLHTARVPRSKAQWGSRTQCYDSTASTAWLVVWALMEKIPDCRAGPVESQSVKSKPPFAGCKMWHDWGWAGDWLWKIGCKQHIQCQRWKCSWWWRAILKGPVVCYADVVVKQPYILWDHWASGKCNQQTPLRSEGMA